MSGVEATAIGLGFFADALVLPGAPGVAAGGSKWTSGSALGSAAVSPAPAGSAVDFSASVSVAFGSVSLLAGPAVLPKMTPVVAAATSRAGITSPSSGGAGSLAGSGAAGFLGRVDLFSGTLRSRTV